MQRQMLESKIHRATVTAGDPGDKVIVVSYAGYDERELDASWPVVVHVGEDNRTVGVDSDFEVLLGEVSS